MADEATQIHWHEGLFLQPHHLQVMQRRMLETIARRQLLSSPYPAGIIAADFSRDSLAKGDLRFTRLLAIMPSGLEVDVDGNTTLDVRKIDPHSFPPGGGSLLVRLAVPRLGDRRANTIEFGAEVGDPKRIYRVTEQQIFDENDGENAVTVRLRRINASLLLGDSDASSMETLPLLRIKNPSVTGSPSMELDETFWPPCLDIRAWPPLETLVRDLADRLEEVRKRIASEMVRGSFRIDSVKPTQMKSLLRLQTLGRASARLSQFTLAPSISPFEMFLELRGLLAELAAVDPGDADYNRDNDLPNFDPENLAVLFQDLNLNIRRRLEGVEQVTCQQIPLERKTWWFEAAGIDVKLLEQGEYYVGINAQRMDRTLLDDVVVGGNKVKLYALAKRGSAVPGLPLRIAHHPSPYLPAGLAYYDVVRNGEDEQKLWKQIREKGEVVLEWKNVGEDIARVEASLFVILPK